MRLEICKGLIENSIVGFYIITENRLTHVNPELAKIFGYDSVDEIIGKSVFEFTAEESRELGHW